MGRPKIGAVSYLNTKPLVAGLSESATDYELIFDLPSRLADRLAEGELDVALIPVIEAVTQPSYTIVSDACIACRGPVWSVKLMSRVPAKQIRTLALDEGSRTSRALTRVLLHHQFGVQPICHDLSMSENWQQTEHDAALIIGDRAMNAEHDDFPHTWDLGTAWNAWTEQPFVFAVWAAREGADLEFLSRILSQARDRGLEMLPAIATEQATKYQLSLDDAHRYLDQYIHYFLGDEEKRGMENYFQLASEIDLIPKHLQLQFHDCQTA